MAQLADTWRLLGHLVGEHDVVNGEFQQEAVMERQYASAYLSADQESSGPRDLRKSLASASLRFLEEQ